jgi:hypothetical protein
MHRIFCATPSHLADEGQVFHDVLGGFNEAEAMSRGILFVPVSAIYDVADGRYMRIVCENIRACRYYVQVEEGTTQDQGTAYRLAVACSADPSLPMGDVVVLSKTPSPIKVEYTRAEYNSLSDFKDRLNGLFSRWLPDVISHGTKA